MTYGSDASSLLAPTPVAQWRTIVAAIDSLAPDGSTNMEAGLLLGYQQARRRSIPTRERRGAGSDGVANVGVTDPRCSPSRSPRPATSRHPPRHRRLRDGQLQRPPDGAARRPWRRVLLLRRHFAEAERLFVDDLTPTLTVVAEDAKVQVVFDPDAVDVVPPDRLREPRSLDDDSSTTTRVDAGELGAGHQVSAVYEVRLNDGVVPGDVAGTVALRWGDPETGAAHQLDRDVAVPGAGAASPSLRLAALVAGTAEVLKGDSVVVDRGVDLATLAAAARSLAATGDAPAAPPSSPTSSTPSCRPHHPCR